jgi:tRNA/tmRNA/rRNA uracil-C5-methylase (TrmA/RlmC/RlmD family)
MHRHQHPLSPPPPPTPAPAPMLPRPPSSLLHRVATQWWRQRRRLAAAADATTKTPATTTSTPSPPPVAVGAVLRNLAPSRLAHDGQAVALLAPSNFVVLINSALPGEVIDAQVTAVKKGYAEAERLRTVAAPPDEASFVHPPPCPDTAAGLLLPPRPVAGGCGGCALQALPYGHQLRHKAEAVRQALVRVGGLSPQEVARAEREAVAAPSAWAYRNKASFLVSGEIWQGGGGAQEQQQTTAPPHTTTTASIGFTAPGTRRTVVPVASCGLQPEGANAVLSAVRRLAGEMGLLSDAAAAAPALRRLVVRSAAAASSSSSSSSSRDHMVVLFTDRGYPRRRLQPLAEALQSDKGLRVASVAHCEEEEEGGQGQGQQQQGGRRGGSKKGGGDGTSTSSRHAPRAPRLVSTTVLAGKPYLIETLRVRPPPQDAATAANDDTNPAAASTRPPLLLLSFAVSAGSFFQVNSEQAGVLYGLVLEAALGGGVLVDEEDDDDNNTTATTTTILDLFCGGGAIGIALARRVAALQEEKESGGRHLKRVVLVGVDSSPAAIADARLNAQRNGLSEDQVAFECGDLDALAASLEAALLPRERQQAPGEAAAAANGGGNSGNSSPKKKGNTRPGGGGASAKSFALPPGTSPPRVVVVNPARAGLGTQAVKLLRGRAVAGSARRLVYVSCNPRTLARDLQRLGADLEEDEEGCSWELEWFRPVDLMPNTDHVETVVRLRRRR